MKHAVFQLLLYLLPVIATAQGCLPLMDYDSLPLYVVDSTIRGRMIDNKFSLRKRCPPVGNQENCNSCCAWSVVYYAMSIQYQPFEPYSPHFICEKTGKCNKGMTPFEAYTIATTHAVPSISQTSPYCEGVPNSLSRVDTLKKINSVETMRAALTNYQPVILILNLNTVKQKPTVENNFYWVLGNLDLNHKPNCHAVCVIGYDMTTDAVEIVNSMGESWGNQGFAEIRFENIFPIGTTNIQAFVLPDK
jgi:Papain family cysteine protease